MKLRDRANSRRTSLATKVYRPQVYRPRTHLQGLVTGTVGLLCHAENPAMALLAGRALHDTNAHSDSDGPSVTVIYTRTNDLTATLLIRRAPFCMEPHTSMTAYPGLSSMDPSTDQKLDLSKCAHPRSHWQNALPCSRPPQIPRRLVLRPRPGRDGDGVGSTSAPHVGGAYLRGYAPGLTRTPSAPCDEWSGARSATRPRPSWSSG
ncbi:hypothetical protein FKP32DRAFT_1760387 [Trametes sanguinea]|nr:hypothetical protein FKP32DRAFT_1760387 [Trametes sanguinea]